MSEIYKYVGSVAQANVVLKNCFETIDRLNDEIYTEKIIRGSKYRETIKKLKNKNAKFPEMDLRDYFAAKALPLVYKHWMHDYYEFGFGDGDEDRGLTPANKMLIAETAYEMADAMMKARAEE